MLHGLCAFGGKPKGRVIYNLAFISLSLPMFRPSQGVEDQKKRYPHLAGCTVQNHFSAVRRTGIFPLVPMIRIAVLHPVLAQGRELQFQLRSHQELQVVHVATERQHMLEALVPLDVQCVVLSAHFEGDAHFPICQEIQVYAPQTQCLVYATIASFDRARRMLHRGAHGCVLAEDGPEILQQAALLVGAGGSFISTEASRYMLGLKTGKGVDGDHRPVLSKREKDVMRAILEEKTTSEIAELLHISFGTVETHRRNILAKVGARNTAGLVRSCYEFSLLD